MEKEQNTVKKTTFYSISSEEKSLKKALEKIKSEDSAYFYGPMSAGASSSTSTSATAAPGGS